MKDVYIGRKDDGYIFSEKKEDLHRPGWRKEFDDEKSLMKYLGGPEMKKTRERGKVCFVSSLKDEGLVEKLEGVGFRSVSVREV